MLSFWGLGFRFLGFGLGVLEGAQAPAAPQPTVLISFSPLVPVVSRGNKAKPSSEAIPSAALKP